MKITTTVKTTFTIRDDWATAIGGYVFTDDGTQVVGYISAKAGTPANPSATPPIVAIPATQQSPTFIIFARGSAYATAGNYTNEDLVAAIKNILSSLPA